MWDQINNLMKTVGAGDGPRNPEQMQKELIALADEFDAARQRVQTKRKGERLGKKAPKASSAPASLLAAEIAKSDKSNAMLAALGALTADWDEMQAAAFKELERRRVAHLREETVERAVKKEKARARRATWLHRLLRLGVGSWLIDSLRQKDIAEYIDYQAGEEMRLAAIGHPSSGYKQFLEGVLIPNAKWVAIGEVVGSIVAAFGTVTGIKRTQAGLLGMAISGHRASMSYRDPAQRLINGLMVLLQLLLLRRPKPAQPISAARRELSEVPQIDG